VAADFSPIYCVWENCERGRKVGGKIMGSKMR